MEFLLAAFHFVVHLDQHVADIASHYGMWAYGILFAIIFAETGLVITPFLPGDSLLFIGGAFAAAGGMDPVFLILTLWCAAVLGNTSNYWIGRWVGPHVFHWEHSRWFNRHALDETHAFYERYGPLTVSLARYIHFVRTFAQFVAGVGAMPHLKFQFWNALGGIVWVAGFVALGYFFGNIPIVQKNLALIMLAVVIISLVPVVIGALRAKVRRVARG